MECNTPQTMDNELFLNYEKNLLLPSTEKVYLSVFFKKGEPQRLFCQHRHWYGKYSFQNKQGEIVIHLLDEMEKIQTGE